MGPLDQMIALAAFPISQIQLSGLVTVVEITDGPTPPCPCLQAIELAQIGQGCLIGGSPIGQAQTGSVQTADPLCSVGMTAQQHSPAAEQETGQVEAARPVPERRERPSAPVPGPGPCRA